MKKLKKAEAKKHQAKLAIFHCMCISVNNKIHEFWDANSESEYLGQTQKNQI